MTTNSPSEPPADDLAARRAAEGRCVRCGNWPDICGHDLPLTDRLKTIAIDRSSLR